MQVPPGPQVVPHEPQWFGSACRFTHCDPQQLNGAPQGPQPVGTQRPPVQLSPTGHCMPQPPQLLLSFCVSMQLVPQHISRPGQRPPQFGGTHMRPTQAKPLGHAFPQNPQS
jgi:hypothetical protein